MELKTAHLQFEKLTTDFEEKTGKFTEANKINTGLTETTLRKL
jgi:hypothetical protein